MIGSIFFSVVFADCPDQVFGDRLALGNRGMINGSGVVVCINVIEFFRVPHLLDVGSVLPEATGGVGGRALLFVNAMEQVVEIVQKSCHTGILVLADLVAETVGRNGGMGVGAPNPFFHFPNEFREKISLLSHAPSNPLTAISSAFFAFLIAVSG